MTTIFYKRQPRTSGRFYLYGQRRYHWPRWETMSAKDQEADRVLRDALVAWCQGLMDPFNEVACVTNVEPIEEPGIPGPSAVGITFNNQDGEAEDLARVFPLALSRELRRLELIRDNSRPTRFP